jgi:caffeyl-CoA reductase-Etf complex subunit CarE
MIRIDQLTCDGCGCCVSVCSQDTLVVDEKKLTCLEERCSQCGDCILACPVAALRGEDHG